MKYTNYFAIAIVTASLLSQNLFAETVWLDELDISKAVSGWETSQKNLSVGKNKLSIAGIKYDHGVGTHAWGYFTIALDGNVERFTALAGVDDEVDPNKASLEFKIISDGQLQYSSGIMKKSQPAKKIDLNLKGKKQLILIVTDGWDGHTYDHADWVNAKFEYSGEKPKSILPTPAEKYILTPKPGPKPHINSPKVFGVRDGSPFLYTIAARGEKPMAFDAKQLPKGLKLNKKTGQITGRLTKRDCYKVTLTAKNKKGKATQELKIIVGDEIALTPPMGWNSWNGLGGDINDLNIRQTAKAMIDTGLADYGYSYINLDACWQGKRDPKNLSLQPNGKFPNFKALCDYVHSLGLKIGLYSTPWITSWCDYPGGSSDFDDGRWVNKPNGKFRYGKNDYTRNDIFEWARWGVDYVKYDWSPNTVKHTRIIANAIKDCRRDIVFSLSNSAPLELAAEWARLCQCWRTGNDIHDQWHLVKWLTFKQDECAEYVRPGHWIDPDMLVVGRLTCGTKDRTWHNCRLTADEQYTHISMWSLLASPLLLSCDLEKIDDFTMSLITNEEVLEVNQDPLGKAARQIYKSFEYEVWAKEMLDHSWAVGLFNPNLPVSVNAKVNFKDLGLDGKFGVRDLWRQKDLGTYSESFETPLPSHGVVFIRLFSKK